MRFSLNILWVSLDGFNNFWCVVRCFCFMRLTLRHFYGQWTGRIGIFIESGFLVSNTHCDTTAFII